MDDGRLAQLDLLKAEGWTFDRETRLLQNMHDGLNAPVYLKSPDGRMHKLHKGVLAVLDGRTRRLGPPTGTQNVIYRAGVLVEINGNPAQKSA